MKRTPVLTVASIAALASAVGTLSAQRSTGPTAFARIAGVVVETDSRPIRRAIVTLYGGREPGRSVVTGDDGRFAFDKLEPGRLTLTASKPAYITTSFGAKRSAGPGTTIALGSGERLENLRVGLLRGAAIAGRIRDVSGQPAPGLAITIVRVSGSDLDVLPGRAGEAVVTDEDGRYRAFGLLPGDYIVCAHNPTLAVPAPAPSRAAIDAELRVLAARSNAALPRPLPAAPPPAAPGMVAPVFYPGTARFDLATVVSVASGEVLDDVDFQLVTVPSASISGSASAPAGVSEAVSVTLLPHGLAAMSIQPGRPVVPYQHSDRQGRFSFSNLPPGPYTLFARSNTRSVRVNAAGTRVFSGADGLPDGEVLWGVTTVTLTGGEQAVFLNLRPTLTVTGRVAFSGTGRPPHPGTIRLTMTPAPPEDGPLATAFRLNGAPRTSASALVETNGTFRIRGLLPGRYTLEAQIPNAAGWSMRSVVAAGIDWLDAPLVIDENNPPPAIVTFSNARTELSGTLIDHAGQAVADIVVVALPADRALWWPDSRRLRATRPDTRGHFAFQNLPPGDYLLAALRDIDDSGWRRKEFLEHVAPEGVRVTLDEGERKVQNLRVLGG
jgi:protocatechuate 3,4-dioxygenase beta subunit